HPLLGMDEHPLPAKRASSIPLRLGKGADRGTKNDPTVFIQRPSLRVIPEEEEEKSAIVEGPRVAGMQPQSVQVGSFRVVESPGLGQGETAIDERFHALRFQGQYPAIGSIRFLQPALFAEGVSEIVEGVGKIGLQLERATGGGLRLFESIFLAE